MNAKHSFACLAMTLVAIGCNQSESDPVQNENASGAVASDGGKAPAPASLPAAEPAKIAPPAAETPSVAVRQFELALRSADASRIEQLLTRGAQRAIASASLPIAPRGTKATRFLLGNERMLADGRATVDCVWEDTDEVGYPTSNRVKWFLRKETHGWRIQGFAARLSDATEREYLLDFERPDSVQTALREADSALISEQGRASSTAVKPAGGARQ